MAKLTLSVDERIVSRAKQYAERHRVSISEMVEAYLAAVVEPSSVTGRSAPILRALRGTLRRGDMAHYRKHIVNKYQ